MSVEEKIMPYPPESELYTPTGDLMTDIEKLSVVMEPFKREAARREQDEKAKQEAAAEMQRKAVEEESILRDHMIDTIQEIWEELPRNETLHMPLGEAQSLAVYKSADRIRVGLSSDDKTSLSGYLPDFSKLDAYEVITFGQTDREPKTIHVFDIVKLRAGQTVKFWGDAQRVHLDTNYESERMPSTFSISDLDTRASLTSKLGRFLNFLRKE